MRDFEAEFSAKIKTVLGKSDPAHDISHVKRVVNMAKKLAKEENANLEIILPAAWLHDLVNLPKDHPQRKLASQMAGFEAIIFLKQINYPNQFFDGIHHAICAHSFSGGVAPETLEAKIVQDADRLDALGAIGMARLFSINTQMKRSFYDEEDPFAEKRPLDDQLYGIDHVYVKLKKIAESMNTNSAKAEAKKRFEFMETFLKQLQREV